MITPVSRRWIPIALVVAAATLFFVANRGAYKGYFSDDDLAGMGWPTFVSNDAFVKGLLTPEFLPSNFRPVGFLYYRYLGRAFKLWFPPYVATIQILHVINVILLLFLLRRMGFSPLAAGSGALFYAFNAAVLEAYWKPMYVFDVLCCLFCLVTLLFYVRGRWLLALIPFWLAYKSKEIAVMLPVALLAYELMLGERKWKHLIPYLVISLNFGLQALLANESIQADSTYALLFTPHMLWNTIAFYSSALLFLPFAGLALVLLPIFVRDRRLYVGLIFMAATLVPMLALPQRMASVYWYVPLAGLAIAFAAVASRTPHWTIALFFILWFPLNYMMLRDKRREILSLADENRWYTTGLLDYSRRVPPLQAVVFQGTPPHMQPWGVEGAIREAFGYKINSVWYKNPQAQEAMAELPMAIVGYYPVTHKVKGLLRTHNELESYLRLTDEVPNFQLGEGWYNDEGDHRWIAPRAEVTLRRPADAKEFEIVAVTPSVKVTVFEDGVSLGTQTLSNSNGNPEILRWKLQGGGGDNKKIVIQTEPPTHRPRDPRTLGIDVRAMGYVAP